MTGTVSEACDDYSLEGDLTYELAGGKSKTFTVRFRSTSAGVKSCTVETGHDACVVICTGTGQQPPVCQVDPPSLDFGTVTVGGFSDRTFDISNEGGGTLRGSVDEACGEYSLVGDATYSLTGGRSQTFTFRFRPTSTGVKDCTVETGNDACVDVSCGGIAQNPTACQVDPPSLDFGTIRVGGSSDLTFILSNTGGGTLSGTVSEACDDYSLVGDATYRLAGGQSKTFTVRFSPTSTGVKSCIIESDHDACVVSCVGTGQLPPVCRVDPQGLDFGTLAVGDSSDRTFSLSNTGGGTLSGTVSEACGDHRLVGDAAYSLTGGQSKTFTVRFSPTSTGVKNCTVETGNDACADVNCTGTCPDPELLKQWTLAKKEFEKRHWDDAAEEFQKVIFNYPGAAIIDSAHYLLGMAYFNQKEYPSAIQEFNKVLRYYRTSLLADDAAFMVAKSDFEMSPKSELDPTHTQKALDGLNRFLEEYPRSERREEAEDLRRECAGKLAKKAYKTGELYYKRGQYESALIYLRSVLNDYHDSDWVRQAQFKVAEVFYKQAEYEKAREEYQRFLRDYPDDKLARKANQRLKEMEGED